MATDETDDKIRKMRNGNALIRKARSKALEWLIAIDQILNAIIAEYFVKDGYRRQLLQHEILTRDFFSTSQKIRILGDLEIPRGIQFRKHHGTLLRQLERLVSWRNMLAHGLPISLTEGARVWINRGGLKPVQISESLVEEMETVYESAFDSLGELYSRQISRKKHTSRHRK